MVVLRAIALTSDHRLWIKLRQRQNKLAVVAPKHDGRIAYLMHGAGFEDADIRRKIVRVDGIISPCAAGCEELSCCIIAQHPNLRITTGHTATLLWPEPKRRKTVAKV